MTNPKFVTKDSGERVVHETGMQRDTEHGKPRFALLMPLSLPYSEQMIVRWANLMARGAEKYDSRNWEQARTRKELERYVSSTLRHVHQWAAGILGLPCECRVNSDTLQWVKCDLHAEDHAAAVFFNITGAEYTNYHISKANGVVIV